MVKRREVDIEWKHGDTTPTRRVQLIGRDGPVNLAGATVTQHAFGPSESSSPVDVANAEEGIIFPARGELDPGDSNHREWLLEYWVTYSNGEKQPFPEVGYFRARVWKGWI